MFSLPKLPYTYDALKPYIDEKTMRIHHGKHHAGYVSNLNDALSGQNKFLSMDVNELIKKLDKIPSSIRTKVRNNVGGHVNHSLFWKIMSPKAGGEPKGELTKAIDDTFGSFTNFREKFSNAALTRFGSGWAWLSLDKGKLKVESTSNQDSPLMAGRTPVLGIEVWEHAYYLKYQNRRADYIAAWWNVVNWNQIAKNFRKNNLAD